MRRTWSISIQVIIAGTAMAALYLSLAPDAAAQPRGRGGDIEVPTLDRAPLAKSDAEKRVLAVLDDVDKNERYLGVPQADGRLLRILTESIGAKHVVELGTSTGYSGLWFALALRNTDGKLTTYEIDAERAATAHENFEQAGVADLVNIVVGDAHEEVAKLEGPIDLLFLDADKEGYLDYLNKLLPLVRPGGLVVAHNMRRPEPDQRFVEAITTNPELETVFLNMHAAGMSVSLKKH
jgi:predicted O-methyltransferase YrrM